MSKLRYTQDQKGSKTTQKWTIFNAIGMTFCTLIGMFDSCNLWLPIFSFFSFSFLLYLRNLNSVESSLFGTLANFITFLRLLLVIHIALLFPFVPDVMAFFLFGLAIFLDGVDGWVAKKQQQQSSFGALFDKSVDAYFVLQVVFLLYLKGDVPAYFLIIGLLPYLYELLLYLLSWQYLKIPPNPIGRYVALLLFLGLLSPFIISARYYFPILLIAFSLTILSFGFSFYMKFMAFKKANSL